MGTNPKPEGSLAETDFADLVQALHTQGWTGTLTVTNRGIGRSVTVQDGRMIFASSSDPDDRLGELLLRRGRISLRQLLDSGKAIGPGKRLGTVLVEQGILVPKELVRAVIEHTQEIIYGAFLWTEGHYRLQPGPASAEVITLKISTPDIIMEGIRRIESWSRIDRAVGGVTARYVQAPRADDVAPAMMLRPDQQALLSMTALETSVESLCSGATMSDFEVCRTLWAFKVIGLVRRTDEVSATKAELEDEGLDYVITEGE